MFHVVSNYPSWAIPLFQIGLVVFLVSGAGLAICMVAEKLRGK